MKDLKICAAARVFVSCLCSRDILERRAGSKLQGGSYTRVAGRPGTPEYRVISGAVPSANEPGTDAAEGWLERLQGSRPQESGKLAQDPHEHQPEAQPHEHQFEYL